MGLALRTYDRVVHGKVVAELLGGVEERAERHATRPLA